MDPLCILGICWKHPRHAWRCEMLWMFVASGQIQRIPKDVWPNLECRSWPVNSAPETVNFTMWGCRLGAAYNGLTYGEILCKYTLICLKWYPSFDCKTQLETCSIRVFLLTFDPISGTALAPRILCTSVLSSLDFPAEMPVNVKPLMQVIDPWQNAEYPPVIKRGKGNHPVIVDFPITVSFYRALSFAIKEYIDNR